MFETDPERELSADDIRQLCGLMLAHIECCGHPSVERHLSREDTEATVISNQRGSGDVTNPIS
jgi:hypothetical protein